LSLLGFCFGGGEASGEAGARVGAAARRLPQRRRLGPRRAHEVGHGFGLAPQRLACGARGLQLLAHPLPLLRVLLLGTRQHRRCLGRDRRFGGLGGGERRLALRERGGVLPALGGSRV
jgi:hypothetical protein